MNLARRNVVIGLSTLAAGTGVIGGSGGFNSVEADRSFEIHVSGDASAPLGLEATNDTIAGMEPSVAGGNDTVYFAIKDAEVNGDAAVNENAVTEFFDAFSVTNNGNPDINLSIDLPESINGVAFTLASERGATGPTDLASETYELTSGGSISVDLRIDTTSGGYVEPTSGNSYQFTIRGVSV